MADDGAREAAARRYADAINAQDLDELRALMTDDHWFIDSGRNATRGQDAVVQSWRSFFGQFQDYRLEIQHAVVTDEDIFLIGVSTCSEAGLTGPMIWQAHMRGEKLAQWRVYRDSALDRERLGLAAPAEEAAEVATES